MSSPYLVQVSCETPRIENLAYLENKKSVVG